MKASTTRWVVVKIVEIVERWASRTGDWKKLDVRACIMVYNGIYCIIIFTHQTAGKDEITAVEKGRKEMKGVYYH